MCRCAVGGRRAPFLRGGVAWWCCVTVLCGGVVCWWCVLVVRAGVACWCLDAGAVCYVVALAHCCACVARRPASTWPFPPPSQSSLSMSPFTAAIVQPPRGPCHQLHRPAFAWPLPSPSQSSLSMPLPPLPSSSLLIVPATTTIPQPPHDPCHHRHRPASSSPLPHPPASLHVTIAILP